MTQFWINPTHVSVLISSPYCSMIMYKVKWNEIWFVGLKGIVSRDGEMMERYLYGPAENSNQRSDWLRSTALFPPAKLSGTTPVEKSTYFELHCLYFYFYIYYLLVTATNARILKNVTTLCLAV